MDLAYIRVDQVVLQGPNTSAEMTGKWPMAKYSVTVNGQWLNVSVCTGESLHTMGHCSGNV